MAAPRPTSRRAFPSSERAPLSAVPTVMLSENGEPALMGRSSASCHHQLSANTMISRVHVKAVYKPTSNPFDRDKVEIMCVGWNGIKLHCQGKTYDLAKGKTFTSDIKDADIMIDVHDARVLVQWPRHEQKDRAASTVSDQSSDEEPPAPTKQTVQDDLRADDEQRLASPVSPSPAVQSLIPPSSPLLAVKDSHDSVVVYEDEPSRNGEDAQGHQSNEERLARILGSSQSSDLSDLSKPEEFSDHDEENDPIIHSFGPFGDNLLPRMASFRAYGSPTQPARSSRANRASRTNKSTEASEQKSDEPVKPALVGEHAERIQNHSVNQLAFSRLSSTPFSTIVHNLPASVRESDCRSKNATREQIRQIIDNTECIGKVAREGKDAAGKPLESEYYYIADFDKDEMRRDAVVYELRKPGLRTCRKQHKVFCPLSSFEFLMIRY